MKNLNINGVSYEVLQTAKNITVGGEDRGVIVLMKRPRGTRRYISTRQNGRERFTAPVSCPADTELV